MTGTKRAALLAVVAIAVGAGLIYAALRMVRFDPTRLNRMKPETQTYTVTEPFDGIEIHGVSHDVQLCPAPDGQDRVICRTAEGLSWRVEVRDGVLTVWQEDGRRWYEHIGIFYWNAPMDVQVFLTEDHYAALALETTSGNVNVPAEFTFERASVAATSGEVDFRADAGEVTVAATSGGIYWKGTADKAALAATSGDIRVENAAAGELRINAASGEIEVLDSRVSGLAKLESTSGGVHLRELDASAISVETTSGGVSGNLSAPMDFSVETVSGNVAVPPSDTSAGRCEIHTVSGDVRITAGK